MKMKMTWFALALVLTLAVGLIPSPAQSAPTPVCEIGCVNEEYCSRDSQCTTRPGGRCNLVCPRNGCCAYS